MGEPASTAAPPLVVRFGDEPAAVALVGGKGASLSRMAAWGLPVPPTAAVTTEAYRAVASDPRVAQLIARVRAGEEIPASDVDEVFAGASLDGPIRDALATMAAEVAAGRPLAVRSSATVEDLGTSSFAGQYTSLLGIDGADPAAVLDAVLRVVASLWHPAPCAYRRALGIDESSVAMAVVLMQMVPARRAGVVFTVDPGGRPDAARIEVVEGLGESLVSGRRTPEAHVVPREAPPAELAVELREALDLALQLEHHEGVPQDVEWAWDGATTWVVQGRPITVPASETGDGFDSAPTERELTTAAIGETLPGVLPPLVWQLAGHQIEQAFRRVLDDLGALSEDVPVTQMVRRVRGRAALDLTSLRALAEDLPGGSAEELESQYFGSGRRGRAPQGASASRPRAPLRHLAHDLRVLATRRRVVQDADTVVEAVRRLRTSPVELAPRSDAQLFAYRARLVDLAVRGAADELAVAALAASAYRRLEASLARHLGAEDAARAAEQVTSESGVRIGVDPLASASVFAGPTWEERGVRPPAVDDDGDRDERRERALSALERRMAGAPSWSDSDLRRFLRVHALRRAVDDAVEQLRRRERTKAAVLRLGGEVRAVHLEPGRRLVERARLDDATDVDLLSDDELRRALVGEGPSPVERARRRRWLERYEAEGPLPARFAGDPDRRVPDLPDGDRLEGWATSPGRATAVAQVVRSTADPFEAGRVLVAEATDPSWSPLFVRAAAIVLERGGPLSHAAILARELGVPAVLNVPAASRVLDGRTVLVDGDAGVVVIEPDGEGT